MKKRITFLLIVVTSTLGLAAQSNLQFNRAINNTGSNVATVTFTVPAGKVWKISSFSAHTGRPAMCDQSQVAYYLKADDALICGTISGYFSSTCSSSCGATATKGSATTGPFWFPENTVIELGFVGALYNTSCSSLSLNGIEFDVTPQ